MVQWRERHKLAPPPPPTIQMFANFCNFAELHLFTLNMHDLQTWQFYEILRHPFQWYQWIFPNLFMSKAEKTMKGSITRTNAFGLSDCRYYNYDVQLSQTVQLLLSYEVQNLTLDGSPQLFCVL